MAQGEIEQQAIIHKAIWGEKRYNTAIDRAAIKCAIRIVLYRYLSEKIAKYFNEKAWSLGNSEFSYAKLCDSNAKEMRNDALNDNGFFLYPSELYENLRKEIKDYNAVYSVLERIFKSIEISISKAYGYRFGNLLEREQTGYPLSDALRENTRDISRIFKEIDKIDFGYRDDDRARSVQRIFERLMALYVPGETGPSDDFFTPKEVCALVARIALIGKHRAGKVYDPSCRSGSVLLEFAHTLGANSVNWDYFGQEANPSVYRACIANLFLYGIDFKKCNIALGNALIERIRPDHVQYDVVVSHLPFSLKWTDVLESELQWGSCNASTGDVDSRGDVTLSYVEHALSSLTNDGVAVLVVSPGALFRGGREGKIRSNFIRNNYLDVVIQLPPNLFWNTSVAPCILVLRKGKTDNRVLFVDGSSEHIREHGKNRLSAENSDHILRVCMQRLEKDDFSRLVSIKEIAECDYNIAVSRWVLPVTLMDSLSTRFPGEYAAIKDVSSGISGLGRDGVFPDRSNCIFIPKIGKSAVVTSVNDMLIKPKNYFQVELVSTSVLARYAAFFLSTPDATRIRESFACGVIPQLNKECILELPLIIPSLDEQLEILGVHEYAQGLSVQIHALEAQLCHEPVKYAEIRKLLDSVNEAGTFEAWIETIPYPVASILRRAIAADADKDKLDYMLRFFEALSEFLATLILSMIDSGLYFNNCVLRQKKYNLARPSFGTWVAFLSAFRDAVKEADSLSDSQTIAQPSAISDTELVDKLCDDRLVRILAKSKDQRNEWKGHGGVCSNAVTKDRVQTLNSQLLEVRDILGNVFQEMRLIRAYKSTKRSGVYTNKIDVVHGSNIGFEKDSLETKADALDSSFLYLDMGERGGIIKLIPLFVLESDEDSDFTKCYFYSRTKSGRTEYVSHHYGADSNYFCEGETLLSILKKILVPKST